MITDEMLNGLQDIMENGLKCCFLIVIDRRLQNRKHGIVLYAPPSIMRRQMMVRSL